MLLQVVGILEECNPLDYASVAYLLQTCKELRKMFLHRKASSGVLAFIRRLAIAAHSDRFWWYVHYGKLPVRARFGMHVHYGRTSFKVTDSRAQVRFIVSMQGKDTLRIECCKPFPHSKERIRAQHCKPIQRRYVNDLRIPEGVGRMTYVSMNYRDLETGVSMSWSLGVDENHPWTIHSASNNADW